MKLKGRMLVAGVAALAFSPMAMKPAFAAKPPMAEKIAAADTTKAKNDGKERVQRWGVVASAIAIVSLIALAGIDPPVKKEEDDVGPEVL